jgi:hypothetical protein
MKKFKDFNFIKIINIGSLTGIIYLITRNIQSFFNQTTYRHLHIDERLVVLNPIINVYQINDFYSRFQDLAPSLLKNILVICSELILGGTLDYGRLYNNIFIFIAGPFTFLDYEIATIVGRVVQLGIFFFAVLYLSTNFLEKKYQFTFVLLSMGLPGAYYIFQNPKPDSLAILFLAFGLKQVLNDENYNKGFFLLGISIGAKIITLIPAFILGIYLIYPLKKLTTIKSILKVVVGTILGVFIAQPALFLPLPRVYNKIFSALKSSSTYGQGSFFKIDTTNYTNWVKMLSNELDISSIIFTVIFITSFIIMSLNFLKNLNLLDNYFLVTSIVMVIFLTFNVERTWNYYLYIPFLFYLIYIVRSFHQRQVLALMFCITIIYTSIGGLFLHNEKALNSAFTINNLQEESFIGAIRYLDDNYELGDYEFKKAYWDSDYYFPGKNIDYFTDFQVIENWEREKEEDPLFDTVDFIVTKSLFTVKSDIKVSQFGELFVYEKNR